MNIFLSVPFSSQVDSNGTVNRRYRQSVERLLAGLREHEHNIYCALEYFQWKMGGTTSPDEELRHDFEQIGICNKMLVLLGERVSPGVQLECGYAYAKGKTMEVYQIGKPAWSNQAFAKVNRHEIIIVRDINGFVDSALRRN